MREILDEAGNVDEAVAAPQPYNVAWEGGPPLHYLVADPLRAVVEFTAGEIVVLPNAGPWHAATNFTRSTVAGDVCGPVLALRYSRPAVDGGDRRGQRPVRRSASSRLWRRQGARRSGR